MKERKFMSLHYHTQKEFGKSKVLPSAEFDMISSPFVKTHLRNVTRTWFALWKLKHRDSPVSCSSELQIQQHKAMVNSEIPDVGIAAEVQVRTSRDAKVTASLCCGGKYAEEIFPKEHRVIWLVLSEVLLAASTALGPMSGRMPG